MNKKLPSHKFQLSKIHLLWDFCQKNVLNIIIVSIILLSSIMKAQSSLTIPNLAVTGSFTGPLANAARNYQMIIDDSQLTALTGKSLTSISFRLPTTVTASWPVADTTFSDYQIYLSNGVEPADRQLNFAANIVGTQTQVRSGSLLIPVNAVSDGTNFTFNINFTTPYLYTGNNLVIEIRHTGSNGISTSIHAAGISTAGYGSLFTACWSSGASVLQGNFSYIKINSSGTLGVKSVEINGETSVYPNPVKDLLYVKSTNDLVELHIFNFVGQQVYSQKNVTKNPQLNVSGLAKGNYVLQMIDKNGNSSSTKFIKD